MRSLLLCVLMCIGVPAIAAQNAPIPRLRNPDVMPKLIQSVDAVFSDQARSEKRSGTVLVHALIDSTGHVTKVQVTRGIGYGLDEEAVAAVSKYVFVPAKTKGVAVDCDVYIEIKFVIKDKN